MLIVHPHLFRKKILYFLSEFTLIKKNRSIFIFLHIKEIIPTGRVQTTNEVFFPFYIEKYFSK